MFELDKGDETMKTNRSQNVTSEGKFFGEKHFTAKNNIQKSERRKNLKEQIKNNRIFAGKTNEETPLEKRIKDAKAKAIKVVREAFAKDNATDESVAYLRKNAKEASKQMIETQSELRMLEQRKKELRDDEFMTQEEKYAALAEINEAEHYYLQQQKENSDISNAAVDSVRSIELGRLKSAPMVSASKNAGKIMKDASDGVVNSMFGEVKNRLDEEWDKEVSKAEEKKAKEKEEKRKLEELRSERKEREEEEEITMEKLASDSMHMMQTQKVGDEVQMELQNIARQAKISLDELKGAAVDEQI